MYCNNKISICNVIGYDEYYQDGLERNGSQHENTLLR